jgi:Tfp pilus assembly protein PilF
MVQLSNNRVGEAKRNINKALEKAPNNPLFQYHSAVIAFTAGDKSSAKKTLEVLLGKYAKFPKKGEAEELLRKLKAN